MAHCINYAHRGASSYLPENTLSAFYLGLWMGADGIETDVRRTRDGVPVLFHDETLERVAAQPGGVGEYTLAQLRQIPLCGPGAPDRIVTLEEFLRLFGFRPLSLAIELKEPGLEEQVLSLIEDCGARERCVVTSFELENLERMRALDAALPLGYLTSRVDDALPGELARRRIGQLCPKAATLTPQLVEGWKAAGFSVRAWGVSDPALMERAYRCGVDGMTVNFPDKLAALLRG